MEVDGKHDLFKYRNFLNKLDITNFIIADFDFLLEIGDQNIKKISRKWYYWNYYYKDIPEDSRGKLIFDYDTKRSIADYLNIDSAVLDNSLSALRRKNLIVGRKIHKTFNIEFGKSLVFEFIKE